MQDVRALLLSHPRKLGEPAALDCLLEFGRGRHSELLVQLLHGLGADALDVQQLEQAGGQSGNRLVVLLHAAGREVLVDLLRDTRTDAGHLLQLAFGVERFDVGAEVGQRSGRLPVGEHVEPGLAPYFERIRDAVKPAGEFLVLQPPTWPPTRV